MQQMIIGFREEIGKLVSVLDGKDKMIAKLQCRLAQCPADDGGVLDEGTESVATQETNGMSIENTISYMSMESNGELDSVGYSASMGSPTESCSVKQMIAPPRHVITSDPHNNRPSFH
jgi:hypothetical protein